MTTSAADFGSVAQDLAAALLEATVDPADAMRLLSLLASCTPDAYGATSPIGKAIATARNATGALFRRAALVALARAAASYQPYSYDNAVEIRKTICEALDAEILIAGDNGEDGVYTAFRNLRAAVVEDMKAKGGDLAPMMTIKSTSPQPSLVLATRLYRDASRADELVTQGNPRHPMFMPMSFKGLSE